MVQKELRSENHAIGDGTILEIGGVGFHIYLNYMKNKAGPGALLYSL